MQRFIASNVAAALVLASAAAAPAQPKDRQPATNERVAALLEQMKSADRQQRDAAAKEFTALGPDALPGLCEYLVPDKPVAAGVAPPAAEAFRLAALAGAKVRPGCVPALVKVARGAGERAEQAAGKKLTKDDLLAKVGADRAGTGAIMALAVLAFADEGVLAEMKQLFGDKDAAPAKPLQDFAWGLALGFRVKQAVPDDYAGQRGRAARDLFVEIGEPALESLKVLADHAGDWVNKLCLRKAPPEVVGPWMDLRRWAVETTRLIEDAKK
jgi:hypothetical protein